MKQPGELEDDGVALEVLVDGVWHQPVVLNAAEQGWVDYRLADGRTGVVLRDAYRVRRVPSGHMAFRDVHSALVIARLLDERYGASRGTVPDTELKLLTRLLVTELECAERSVSAVSTELSNLRAGEGNGEARDAE